MEWCAKDGAALCDPDDLARVGLRFSNYEITDVIGVGGMGVVYKGLHTALRKPVAVKILNEHYGRRKNAYNEMLREAQAASRIRNPHIVDVTDFGTTDEGSAYLVMEYLEGESLSGALMRDVRLPVRRAVEVVRQVANALDAAHQAGIIHRDLKPENVYLVRRESGPSASKEREPADGAGSGGEIHVKLLDFGLAKVQDMGPSTRTKAGMIAGTPYYMSPEQAQNKPVDPRSDVYSLGVLFYHMVTGVLPFTGSSSVDILMAHLAAPPSPPHRVCPSVDEGTSQVILKCLKKDPSFRFQNMGELCDALQHCGAGADAADAPDEAERSKKKGVLSATEAPLPAVGPTVTSDLLGQVLSGSGESVEVRAAQAAQARANQTVNAELVAKVTGGEQNDADRQDAIASASTPPPAVDSASVEEPRAHIIRDRSKEGRPLGTGSVEPKLLPVGSKSGGIPEHQVLTDPALASPARRVVQRRALLAAVVALTAVAIGFGVYIKTSSGKKGSPGAGVAPTADEGDDLVRIRLDGVPAGAEVLLDDKVTTQRPLMLRRSGAPRRVAVIATGFVREERRVIPSEHQRLLFSLTPLPRAAPAPDAAPELKVARRNPRRARRHARRVRKRPKPRPKPAVATIKAARKPAPAPAVRPAPRPTPEPKPTPKPTPKPQVKPKKKRYSDWVIEPDLD